MRVFLAALVIVLLAGPAFAQSPSIPKYGELDGKKPHEIKADKEAEQAYQKSLGRIPEQKGSTDPWGNVRSDGPPKDGAPKAAAKDSPAKRAKAAGTAN